VRPPALSAGSDAVTRGGAWGLAVTKQPRSRELRHVAGRTVYFDSEGFFWEPNDWTTAAASELARESGIVELDETQWRVIRFLRDYYLYHGRTPMNRELKAGTGLSLVELERSFPDGIKFGARRLAGLPNPKTCLE
jgi:dissimilatory sulfite reductase related protein